MNWSASPAIEASRVADRLLEAEERATTWRAIVLGCTLVGIGEILYALIGLKMFGVGLLLWMRLAHAALAFAVAIASVLIGRRHFPVTVGQALILPVVLFYLPTFWLSEATVVGSSQLWVPFAGQKLVLIGLALLCPGPAWYVGALMALIAGEALVEWRVFEENLLPYMRAADEPWVTLLYGFIAAAVLFYRVRARSMGRTVIRARVRAEALEEVAEVMLAARDRANTPLQVLAFGLSQLLSRRPPLEATVLLRMQHALASLSTLNQLFSRYDDSATRLRGLAALDADETLQRLLIERGPPSPAS
jgi:hypothetical protein